MPSGHEMYLDLTGDVINACYEVQKTVGFSLPKEVYKKALKKELEERGINFSYNQEYDLEYKGEKVYSHLVDFVLDGKVVLIIASRLGDIDTELIGRVVSARDASGLLVGLIVNFGNERLGIRRLEKRDLDEEEYEEKQKAIKESKETQEEEQGAEEKEQATPKTEPDKSEQEQEGDDMINDDFLGSVL